MIGIWRFVGCSYQGLEWGFLNGFTIAENMFVYQRQQGVQNGGAGFPDFIQKGEIGFRQIVVCFPNVVIFFQRLNGDRAKYLAAAKTECNT